ncbi:hypothetical protein PEKONANI_01657 [Aeromonas jandaei]|uniref:hypothetical protein n=1 Tax=Aeromonas jandaei TaxID=650 RepID=UPI00366E26D2
MSQSESFDFFFRFLKERHEELKNDFTELKKALVLEDKAAKLNACKKTYSSADNLSKSLSSKDQPGWLSDLISGCKWYITNNGLSQINHELYDKYLVKHQSAVMYHTWDYLRNSSKENYSFDEIYERFKKDSKLQELFDALISTLEKIILSDQIDSIRTKMSLEQLLAMLKQNQTGSYFSTMASWEFLKSFTHNLVWESLDDIPVVKNLKKAFEKTVLDMDVELDVLHKNIAEEMKAKYNTTVQTLTYKNSEKKLLEETRE